MQKVSAIIITYNEELHIAEAIESLNWADEILVTDSFSTDNTLEIAKKHPRVRILQFPFENHGKQKNLAIPEAKHPWVFILDADERVPVSLREEIKLVLSKPTPYSAFSVGRRNFIMEKEIRYSGWQNDRVTRLFLRDECRYNQNEVHEEIETKGQTGRLKNRLLHYTYRNLSHYLQKFDAYTTSSAYDRLRKTKNVTLYHLLVKPLFRFVNHYFFRLGILDGKVGFILSATGSYSVFLRYLKAWRILKGEKLK